jgi:hypothetical protein
MIGLTCILGYLVLLANSHKIAPSGENIEPTVIEQRVLADVGEFEASLDNTGFTLAEFGPLHIMTLASNLTVAANFTLAQVQQLPPPDDGLLHKQFWPLDSTDFIGFACAGKYL